MYICQQCRVDLLISAQNELQKRLSSLSLILSINSAFKESKESQLVKLKANKKNLILTLYFSSVTHATSLSTDCYQNTATLATATTSPYHTSLRTVSIACGTWDK